MTRFRFVQSIVILLTLFTGAAAAITARHYCLPAVPQQQSPSGRHADVRVEATPSTPIVWRDIMGSYAQHPAMLAELRRYVASTNLQATGPVMGIYPMDPGVVPEHELHWQVAVPVSSPARVQSPYAVTIFPPTETVALTSTVGRLEADANFLKQWVVDHGFVQTGATRMLFHDPDNSDPLAVKTTIVYPVTRRAGN